MKILVINGPNLNMLGKRETGHYGSETLADIEGRINDRAGELGAEVEFFQSNHEGAIVDHLQEAAGNADGIVINPGALTHYGLSMRDALADTALPIVEIHLSNIHARERFRRRSVVAPLAVGQVSGLGWRGYLYALDSMVARLKEASQT
jgi:3-dehydroquinate dehydratase-2